MATLTIRMPEGKAERLKALAAARDISLNKLIEELTTQALAAFDVETRFRIRAARGSAKRGLEMLDELDAYYAKSPDPQGSGAHGFHDLPQEPVVPKK